MQYFETVLWTLVSLLGVCTFRALFLYKSPPAFQPYKSHLELFKPIELNDEIIARFMGALDIPTISYKSHTYDQEQLEKFIRYLEKSFPNIHKSSFIKREIIANYTLLYSVNGSDMFRKPYMLTSHIDVVPAVKDKWSSDPFKSVIKDDKHIYARGTIDAKHLLMAILESLETMLDRGHKPLRSFYLVFGHDEEVGGEEGAQSISKLLPKRLRAKGWRNLEYILDEGNIISKTPVPGIESPIALIGVAEKGYVTMKMSTVGSVGHGSMPPAQTAISKLSKAVGKFHSHLFPSMFGKGVERDMLEIFAHHSKWPYKFFYANYWLFYPIFEYTFSNDPATNSLIRTSTAVTMIQGGTKENVLPDSAWAYINHRVHPLQTIDDVLTFDKQIIGDSSINLEINGYHTEPTRTSRYDDDCFSFRLIRRSLQQTYPNIVVVPSLFLAASDSKWYSNLTSSIYRFSAIAVPLEEMKRFHGHDERISLENYGNLIEFYHRLISNSDMSTRSGHLL